MIENRSISRRQILAVLGAAAVSATIPAYLKLRRSQLEVIEKYAIETQKGLEIKVEKYPSSSLADYEDFFKTSFGNSFTYKRIIELLKKQFSKEKPLFVADIGGASGTAAKTLDDIADVEAFVIDPSDDMPLIGDCLPRERYIHQRVEHVTLPSNTFHFLTSFNTFRYIHLSGHLVGAMNNSYRLLKSGGCAAFEFEDLANYQVLDTLSALPYSQEIHIAIPSKLGIKPLTVTEYKSLIQKMLEKKDPAQFNDFTLLIYQSALIIDKR